MQYVIVFLIAFEFLWLVNEKAREREAEQMLWERWVRVVQGVEVR